MHSGDDFKSLQNTQFYNNSKPSVMYIHGWQGKFERRGSQGIIDAYLARGDHNFIFVDWSQNAGKWNYAKATIEINETTEFLANLLLQMRAAGYNLDKFHLIGYSAGAHYAGQVGEHLKQHNNIWLPRITGLDPAGPIYNRQQISSQVGLSPLRKGNARFVDIIHTDAGFFGIQESTGDIDFWPNCGTRLQPGCDFKNCYFSSDGPFVICSHDRSWKFFSESVRNPGKLTFMAKLCPPDVTEFNEETCTGPEIASMGIHANLVPSAYHGNYFLTTNNNPPFSMS